MNRENRFDHIVGLIYDAAHDTAHDSAGNDAVLQAIQAELGNPEEPHEDADNLMRRLTPHLARSDSLRGRIRQLQMQHFIQQVELTNLPFGLVWVGADLRVVTQNARAESLL